MRRLDCIAVSIAASVTLVMGTGISSAFAARTVSLPATPTNVTAMPGVATITVSWRSPHETGVTYTVSSVPTGKGCVVVALASCTIPVTESTPWRYQVTASIGSLSSTASALTPVVPHRTLAVLAGQSNATGAQSYAVDAATGINYLAAPYTDGADTTSTIGWMPWLVNPVKGHEETGQVALDTPQLEIGSNGKPVHIFGPEIGWARQIYADTGQSVSVIKTAFPNTSLAGYWLPSIPGGLFSQMITTVTSTMAADARQGQLDTIGAFAWYQGESDAEDPTMAPDYQTNLSAFIIALRSDLPADPTTPIVLVKESLASLISFWETFGSCGTTENCTSVAVGDAEVRAADDWAGANLAHVIEVDTLGLPRFDGLIHLTNTSELAIGEKIAMASDRLMPWQHLRDPGPALNQSGGGGGLNGLGAVAWIVGGSAATMARS